VSIPLAALTPEPAPAPADAPAPDRLHAFLAFALSSFGPILVFYGVDYGWGLMPAIAASALWSIGDVVRHVVTKKPLTMIFKFSAVMTVLFGIVDLVAQQSLLFKYEAVVTNLGTAAVFGATLRGGKSIVQESYESSPRAQGRKMPEWLPRFFRVLTVVWVAYFIAKAGLYFFIARAYSIEESVAIRALVGNVSMFALLGITWVMAKLYGRKYATVEPAADAAQPEGAAAPD
jgi:uncharacterized membrane protein